MHWETLRFSIVNNGIALLKKLGYSTPVKHLLSFYKMFLRFHLNYCELFNEQPCSVNFPDTVESIQYNTAAKHLLSFYSETSLQRTPTGSQNSVRYREVSATKRLFLNWLILLQKLTLGWLMAQRQPAKVAVKNRVRY